MQLSISNLAFTGFNIAELTKLPEHTGIEIFYEFGNPHLWQEVLSGLYRTGTQRSLSIHGPCIGINLADPRHNHYLEYYRQMLEHAAAWKAEFVVVHTNEGYAGDPSAVRSLIYERLGRIFELAGQQEVRIVLENVGLTTKQNLLFAWPDYQRLLADFPQAGALLDTGHAYINGWSLAEVVTSMGSRLTACHLHDNDGRADLHLPVGEGTIDWAPFFAAIRQSAPDTRLVFEYANVSLGAFMQNMQQVSADYCLR